MLAKEEVVKLLASQEQGGRLHYPPGMCRISCKATCKEVVLSVRKLTLQVLRSVWKAAFSVEGGVPDAEPWFPGVQLRPACLCKV